jgi:hypothetical protein
MSPPDLEPLDADLAALLDAERARPDAARAAQGRVLARVMASVGPGGGGPPHDGGGGGAAPGGMAPGAAGAGAGGLLKSILIGLALGSVVAAGIVTRPDPQPAAPAIEASVPVEATPAKRLEASGDDAGAPEVAAPAPRAFASASASAGRDGSLGAERLLLDEAQHAVSQGHSAAAFAALERHVAEFPRGRMSEEREAIWIRALAGAGRIDEARERAARFRRGYPRSMLVPALESIVGTIP